MGGPGTLDPRPHTHGGGPYDHTGRIEINFTIGICGEKYYPGDMYILRNGTWEWNMDREWNMGMEHGAGMKHGNGTWTGNGAWECRIGIPDEDAGSTGNDG